MADAVRLPTPRIRVYLDDGSVQEVQTVNADLLAFDRIASRRKWPSASEAPMVWLNFIAHKAMVREGSLPGDVTVDQFEDRALAIEAINDEDGREPAADPTSPGREDT